MHSDVDWLHTPYDLAGKRVWVAGADGMVGGALIRRLRREECELITVPKRELDLRNQQYTHDWIKANKPDVVILAAARVGGIAANDKYRADFLYDNLMIEGNVIHGSYLSGVEKLLFLGSSCIYPKNSSQPIRESDLLTGALETTNESYAVAKISGMKMCEAYRHQYGCDFISAMPCNLYGAGDRYDVFNSHVIPALIMKMHEAKLNGLSEVNLWGSGKPRREFLYVDDLADGLIFLIKNYSGAMHVNIGAGEDISISSVSNMIAELVGFNGQIIFDSSMPDGVYQKLMDCTLLRQTGWRHSIDLADGLKLAYKDYLGRMIT